jgi:hypothetical protein
MLRPLPNFSCKVVTLKRSHRGFLLAITTHIDFRFPICQMHLSHHLNRFYIPPIRPNYVPSLPCPEGHTTPY